MEKFSIRKEFLKYGNFYGKFNERCLILKKDTEKWVKWRVWKEEPLIYRLTAMNHGSMYEHHCLEADLPSAIEIVTKKALGEKQECKGYVFEPPRINPGASTYEVAISNPPAC